MKIKSLLLCLVCAASSVSFVGCAAYAFGSPVPGVIYADVKAPIVRMQAPMSENVRPLKIGKAMCTSICGIIANGDASIQTAMENGKITKIHHVDVEITNILSVYATFTLVVYGE